MDDLKKVIDSTLNVHPKGSITDLLISEIFRRHGIEEDQFKSLSPGQKKQIKQVVGNIQNELKKVLD